jgi:hypothetical protein
LAFAISGSTKKAVIKNSIIREDNRNKFPARLNVVRAGKLQIPNPKEIPSTKYQINSKSQSAIGALL